jgi:hypothetical protein
MTDFLDRMQQVITRLEQVINAVRQDDASVPSDLYSHVISQVKEALSMVGDQPLEDVIQQAWWRECQGRLSNTVIGLQLAQIAHLVNEHIGQREEQEASDETP